MSAKIAKHSVGQCVRATIWRKSRPSVFFEDSATFIGIILDYELVKMIDTEFEKAEIKTWYAGNENDPNEEEYLYRVLVDGSIEELWEYEISLVNAK
jgi:hypothetical protein